MIQPAATTDTDPLLLPYLTAPNDEAADEQLARLLDEHVEPVAKGIISYKLRVYFDRSSAKDADDVFGDTVVSLLTQLSQLRRETQSASIRNFRSYVAVTTYRACSEYLRRKYPQRHSLKNKLRYFLRHQRGFALWEDASGDLVGGLSEWQSQAGTDESKLFPGSAGVPPARVSRIPQFSLNSASGRDARAPREELAKLLGVLDDFQRLLPHGSAQGLSLHELLTAIFKRARGPLELDSLVSVVAELWQVKDVPPSDERENEERLSRLVDSSATRADELEQQSYLATLWGEIKQLSPQHAAALLLNLRDEQNQSVLDLFLFTGTASFQEIAAALGQTEQWLAEVWNGLPMADALIAEHLALERQQVINLRRTARLRLARRMGEIL